MKPKFTVLYNLSSPEEGTFVGTGWEFFTDEAAAQACYERHVFAGNCPTKRPYDDRSDYPHLGAVHRTGKPGSRSITTWIIARRSFEDCMRKLKTTELFLNRSPDTGKYTNHAYQTAWTAWKMREGLYNFVEPDDNQDTYDLWNGEF